MNPEWFTRYARHLAHGESVALRQLHHSYGYVPITPPLVIDFDEYRHWQRTESQRRRRKKKAA